MSIYEMYFNRKHTEKQGKKRVKILKELLNEIDKKIINTIGNSIRPSGTPKNKSQLFINPERLTALKIQRCEIFMQLIELDG